jgi:hypothetical protein
MIHDDNSNWKIKSFKLGESLFINIILRFAKAKTQVKRA